MSYRGISVFVCFLLAIADVCFHPRSGESAQRPTSNAVSLAKSLQGDAAIQQLKADGSYASLAEAMAAASAGPSLNSLIPQQRKLTAADAAMEDEFGSAVALSGNTAVVGAPADDIGENTNQGSAHVFVRSGSAWSLQQKLTASDGDAQVRFGTSVAINGDTLAVGVRYANGDRGAVYVFTRNGTTWTPQPRLTANDGAAFDFFGDAVALNGDTLAVGAHSADISGRADQGAVYVYVRQGAGWMLQWKLLASDGEAFDEFGSSVAISGDNVLVGAPLDDVGANADQGSAYVFVRVGNTWSQQKQLLATGGAADDNFGCAVAISGDTAAVGAKLNDFNDVNRGSVYTFVRTGTNWMQEQQLVASGGRANDRFGQSVALSGDTLVAGAAGNDVGGVFDQGSAYVFVRDRATSLWLQQRHLFPDAEAARSQPAAPGGIVVGIEFGFAVALSGDAILAGAPFDDGAFRQQGAAYAFVIRANNHIQQQQITANDGAAFDNFGISVALSGDTAVAGTPGDDVGGNGNQGSASVFTRSGTVWTLQQKLTANDGAPDDRFGESVALSGDTVVVGAFGDDALRGSAYVFTRSGTAWTPKQKLTASDGAADDRFGASVALNSDTMVVSAVGDNIGANTDQGAAYLFTRGGTVWMPQQKLTADDGAAFDQFGVSSALSGDTVVVGAFTDDIGVNMDQGSAYVFARSGTVWTQQQKLTANDGANFDSFGFSVALSGDTVVVGAYRNNIGTNADQGSACVFTRSGATWTQQQKLTVADGGVFDNFGISVALSGDTVVVGAGNDDIGANADQGSAYVFTRGGSVWTQQQKLTAADGAASDQFGQSVALSGDTVVVGAIAKTIGTNVEQGAAYVFVSPACPLITLDPATLPGAQPGVPYSQTVTASGGAVGPYQYSLSDGALPPGLTLSPTGQLFGTPTVAGTYRFTITATILDSLCNGSRSYTLSVQPNCPAFVISPTLQNFTAAGGTGSISVTGDPGCSWTAVSNVPWILFGNSSGTGNGAVGFAVGANNGGPARTGTILVAGQTFTVNQAAFNCTFTLSPASFNVTALGGPGSVDVTTQNGCVWLAVSNAPWITITDGANGTGNGTFSFSIAMNPAASSRAGTVTAGGQTFTVSQDGATQPANGLLFHPLPRPLRLLDTRPGQVGCDAPGAQIPGDTSRTQLARRSCDGISIPANAMAVTGNITTVQSGGGYVTLYPSDAAQPLAANSNYAANEIINNVFTVGLGNADGAFKIFVTSNTHVVVDVTGYYAPPEPVNPEGLYFHPLPKPIRLLETRTGFNGAFTPGAPLPANADTPQQARVSFDGVTIPNTALAIVGNATTVNGGAGFLTLYPGGVPRPLAASSNFSDGQVMNAPFTVGLSAAGVFNIFTTTDTDLIIDVLGYYSSDANDGNGAGLFFNSLPQPVRLLETRAGFTGCYAPATPLLTGSIRNQQARGACSGQTLAANALAIVGNATVIHNQAGYLTFWPNGAAQPLVASSNFAMGQILNRHFTVGLGATGIFNIFTLAQTDLIVDVSGFFAP